jgi:flagellin
MALNSINTNLSALAALQSLNRTNDALGVTQKRVSTGFRVADAKDDGAAFAVAQTVRADMSGLQSANEQLGGVKGVLDTTLAGLTKVSDSMKEVRALLVKLADDTINADQREQYESQYDELRNQISYFLRDAAYNNRTLLAPDAAGPAGTAPTNLETGDVVTVRNEIGTTYTIAETNAADLTVAAAPADAAAARVALDDGGNFGTVMTALNTALNTYGSVSRYVDSQIAYNQVKLDNLESGLGALIDADLAKESARLQALQIRQQLGTQSLSIANQAPQALVSLFGR